MKKDNRKVIYISGSQLPSHFANAYQKVKTCEALSMLGVDVTLLSQSKAGAKAHVIFRDLDAREVFPMILFEGRRGHIRYSFTVLCWILNNCKSKDVVLYTREVPLVYVVMFAKIFLRIPYIYESHGYFSRNLYDFLRRRIMERGASGIVSISHGLDKKYSTIGVQNRSVAFCGVDEKRFSAIVDRKDLRRKSGIVKGVRLIGYIGSFHFHHKGVSTLLEAFAKLRARCAGERLELWIVGGKKQDIDKLKGSFPTEGVRYLGRVSSDEVPKYQAMFDVLVIPTIDTGDPGLSPVKMFEYLFSGTPIVASAIPPLKEVLSEGDNSLLFRSGDSDDLAKKIKLLLEKDDT